MRHGRVEAEAEAEAGAGAKVEAWGSIGVVSGTGRLHWARRRERRHYIQDTSSVQPWLVQKKKGEGRRFETRLDAGADPATEKAKDHPEDPGPGVDPHRLPTPSSGVRHVSLPLNLVTPMSETREITDEHRVVDAFSRAQ